MDAVLPARVWHCGMRWKALIEGEIRDDNVCQYQSALCGSNFLVCCVLRWPRMPQLLATTVFGLQGRF